MSRKRKPLPILENIEITDLAAEGKALARVDGKVVFVRYVIPGDIVDLQVRRKKNSYMEAEVIGFHKYASQRVTPFCSHYGICGGCKWQILPYDQQIAYKQQQVEDALQRIGHLELPPISPILGSKQTKEYRNKLEFSFSDKRWLTTEQIASGEKFEHMEGVGFHIPGAFDKILDIHECHLMTDINNRLRNAIRDYAYEHQLTFFNPRTHDGLLRNIMIRTSTTGELMLLLQFSFKKEDDRQRAMDMLEWIDYYFPEITSLLYVDNQKANDTFGDLEVCTFAGNDHIYEEMEGLHFKIGPKSFYQTNSRQAYELYKVAREFACLTGKELEIGRAHV